MRDFKIYIKIAVNLILMVLAILAIFFLVPPLLRFFMPFVIGWIISMIANPLVKFLENKVKILRKHSSAIIIVTVILVIVGVFYALIAFLFYEIKSLLNDMPNIYKSIEMHVNQISENFQGLYEILPNSVQAFIDKNAVKLNTDFASLLSKDNLPSISTASNFAMNIVETFLMSIITLISAYFFIAERDNIVRDVKKSMPNSVINSYSLVVNNFKTAVGGYFKAQFKIMIVILLILFIGFEILQVNYSLLLAICIAFLDFLPFLGTGAVIWPWALSDFILGNYGRAIVLIVIYLICQIVKQVLQPKMVGDSIGISPLSTLVFMFVGYRFMGVLGMIIGIPIGMALTNFYRLGMLDRIIRGFKIIIHDINEFRKF